jgi:hypothetical protein
MAGLSHAAADAARAFRFVDGNAQLVLLPWVNATGSGPGSFSPSKRPILPCGMRRGTRKGLYMRNFTKGLMGTFAAASVALTAPAYAGVAAPAKADGFHQLDQSSDFYKKRKDRRYYARDQRVNDNTRVWRDNDGRYRCKKDNGTTGLLIGGAVGGVAGHEIAGGGDKLLGTVLGAAGGALLGREIDKSKYSCR